MTLINSFVTMCAGTVVTAIMIMVLAANISKLVKAELE